MTLALLVPAAMVLELETYAHGLGSLLLSNLLDSAMVSGAAVCCFVAARRSAGYPRQLWTLLGVALALESAAQGISTYYQWISRGTAAAPWPSDVLFFLWPAPVFLMFLPYTEQNKRGVDWLRVLDFSQVAIVAATIYLRFFYDAARWEDNTGRVLRHILVLYILRDLILAAGLVLLAIRKRTAGLGRFFGVLAVAFIVAAAAEAGYLATLNSYSVGAGWPDLIWLLPYAGIALFAATWKGTETEPEPQPGSRLGQLISSDVLPVCLPLVVILLGRSIATQRFYLGWLAVTLSFLCAALRLIVTNRRERRIAGDLLQTERALHRSEHMFTTAFRSSPDSFSINLFPDGRYIEVNDGFWRLTGYSREEVLGKTPKELDLWEDHSRRDELMRILGERGELGDSEFWFHNRAGARRAGLISGTLVELDGKRCALITVRDITLRKEAEAILRANEERFRRLVEDLPVGIVQYGPDARIQFANRAATDIFEFRHDEVQGKTGAELGLIPLEEDGREFPDVWRPIPDVIQTGKAMRGRLVGWKRPGYDWTVWTVLDAIPERNAAGEIWRVLLCVTDVTQRRATIDALRESEERFRTLVRDLNVGVVLHGPDETIHYVNPAALEMFHASEESVLGKAVEDLGFVALDENGEPFPAGDLPHKIVIRERRAVRGGLMGWRIPGVEKTLWIYGNAIPQFREDGSLLRVIASFADITELKNAERDIHQLSMQLLLLQDEERRRIGRELHDGLAQTILAVNLSLAQARQSISPLGKETERNFEKARGLLQQMSREIRTMSYLLHPPLLDDLGLVSALKEYVHGFSERSGIETYLYLQSDFPRLSQEAETALFRIVQESLGNVQKHSGSSTARIRLRQEADLAVLEIADQGKGMALPGDGRPESGGIHLGVGLPGIRERLAQLGGELQIESGESGTSLRATIPILSVTGRRLADGVATNPDRG